MANPGAFCADAKLKTLLVDLNAWLLLSSSCRLDLEALGGTCQLISQNQIRFKQVIIRTCNPDLSLIVSSTTQPSCSRKCSRLADQHVNNVPMLWSPKRC